MGQEGDQAESVSAWHFLVSQDKPAGTRSGPSCLWMSLPVFPISCWLFTYHPAVPFLRPSHRRLAQHLASCSHTAHRVSTPSLPSCRLYTQV